MGLALKAYFIKLGGSLITDKSQPMHARPDAIRQIAQEIAELYAAEPGARWFIGNGAGSYGHHMVYKTGWQNDRRNMQSVSLVRQATAELNRLVVDELITAGLPVVVLPAASFMERSEKSLRADSDPIVNYSKLGAVVSVYGDVVYDDAEGTAIASTEEIIDTLARDWIAKGGEVAAVIYCVSVDGVLDQHQKVIAELREEGAGNFITGSAHPDVTGGMKQKVAAGFKSLDYTNNVYIVNGRTKGALTSAVAGKQAGTKLVR